MSINKRLRPSGGFTLPELVLLVVVLAVGSAGIFLAFKQSVMGSADPMVRKQAVAVAESLMEEILVMPYSTPAGAVAGTTRANFNSVGDWAGFATTGIQTIEGAAVPGLANYNVSVAVATTALNGIAASKKVTVTVTAPAVTFSLDGYKLDWP